MRMKEAMVAGVQVQPVVGGAGAVTRIGLGMA